MTMQHDAVLDTAGLLCPEPIMLLHAKVDELAPGQVLHILATDPTTERDFKLFCRHLGHELIHQSQNEDIFKYWIKIK